MKLLPYHRLGLVAGTLFLISFFLPAYGDASGFACLKFCWGEIFDYDSTNLGVGLYYPAFVLTNAIFVLLLISGLMPRRPGGIAFVLSLAALAHVLSWLALNLYHLEEKFEIKAGYFVWLVAYILLSLLLLRRRQIAAVA